MARRPRAVPAGGAVRIDLNKSESVTVLLRSKGGGQIWIRAYGPASPLTVLIRVLVRGGFDDEHRLALAHARCACRASRTYRELISWTGDLPKDGGAP